MKNQYFIWVYPLVMLIVQIIPLPAMFICGVLFFTMAVLLPMLRNCLLLFGATAIGHFLWVCFTVLLDLFGIAGEASVIAGRFGLLGYLVIFSIWIITAPAKQNYFCLGKADAEICFPFIWSGKKELIWRFVFVFSAICVVPIAILAFSKRITLETVAMGVVFTFVNAVLEELLWRGMILSRVVDAAGEKQALIITALAFGLYHISLGFPLWACCIFAIGGFYMGGSTVTSKGLLAALIMHIMVNLLFVFAGLIF